MEEEGRIVLGHDAFDNEVYKWICGGGPIGVRSRLGYEKTRMTIDRQVGR